MNNTKQKRPRKPLGAIKVGINTRSHQPQESALKQQETSRTGNFEWVGDMVAFVDDKSGRWVMVEGPSI